MQGRSSFFVKGWEYLACLVGADGQLGVVLEPEEDIFQVKMEQLSEQFSREAQDASYEVTEDAVEITKALNGLSAVSYTHLLLREPQQGAERRGR